MNNKAIIEFGFRSGIRRILQISEGVIHLGLQASVDNTFLDLENSSYPTQPHSIIANYLQCQNKISYITDVSGLKT